MAKPSWVSVSPSSGSGNRNVSVGVTTNGNFGNDRSGSITVTGSIGAQTITKTITVAQAWAATIRVISVHDMPNVEYPTQIANLDDSQAYSTSVQFASELKVCYPYLGGSNICNYSCEKVGAEFVFTLNKIFIDIEDDYNTHVHGEYWDIANAFFTAVGSNRIRYTPVLEFKYTPTFGASGTITVTKTLYSLGGTTFQIDPDATAGPDRIKMMYTGKVGSEAAGYGALSMYYSANSNYYAGHWWMVRMLYKQLDGAKIRFIFWCRCANDDSSGGSDLSTLVLNTFSWTSQRDYHLGVAECRTPWGGSAHQEVTFTTVGSNMENFYHPDTVVYVDPQ